uniref:VPS37 C-terminal domain-containing protein n=2 Tax=Zea mays TaxID=4577 RepID=A0A804Q592_MAIZE
MHKVVRMVEVLEGRNDYTDRSGYNGPPDFRSQSQYQGHVNPAGQGQGYNNPQERSNFSQGQAGEHLLLLQHLGLMANHQHLDLMVNLIHLVTMGRGLDQHMVEITGKEVLVSILAQVKDKETGRGNLEKEQRILELRNQCTIIRTTKLAAAQDRLTDLERQKDDIMRSYSPAALLDKLQTSMAKLDKESEELHQKFLEKDIDLPTFVQKYKKLRTAYHKQALLHLAGQTSLR